MTEYNDKEDIFVHYSAIKADGYKTLSEGQEVSFNLINTNKGYQAQNVEIINTGKMVAKSVKDILKV